MIKSKLFNLQSPNNERSLSNTTEQINEFFLNLPNSKIINIEHIYSPDNNNFGSSFCKVCVWYTTE